MSIIAGLTAANAITDLIIRVLRTANAAAPEIVAFYRLFRRDNPELDLPDLTVQEILDKAGMLYNSNLVHIAEEQARLALEGQATPPPAPSE